MSTALDLVFEKTRAENRAALIAYIPAGFPSQAGCAKAIQALAAAGVDAIEIGFPYSDPVMDGPTIQEAANTSLNAGTGAKEVFEALAHATARGIPRVVMTYWNPVISYGVEKFAHDLAEAGGAGLITPDLIPDEAKEWLEASDKYELDRVFLTAPTSTPERVKNACDLSRGFVYAVGLLGVTGERTELAATAISMA
mgnify:CR=1 FL=1